MRKIEMNMIDAVINRKNLKSSNTEVKVSSDGCIRVYLFDNLIASIFDDVACLFDVDERTVTTKSRLNALLSLVAPAWRINQVKGEWILTDADNNKVLWVGLDNVNFVNGELEKN